MVLKISVQEILNILINIKTSEFPEQKQELEEILFPKGELLFLKKRKTKINVKHSIRKSKRGKNSKNLKDGERKTTNVNRKQRNKREDQTNPKSVFIKNS